MKYLALALIAAVLSMSVGCGECNEEKERREQAARREKSQRAEATPGEQVVKLEDEAIVFSQLQTVEARRDSALVTVQFPGQIEFNQNATAVVSPPLEGRLREWRVNIGDRIKKDDVLARVESPQNLDVPILLKTPLGGEVIERNAVLGDWVRPGDKLAVITELGTMWAIARVREDMVGKILTNEPASIRVLSFPGDTFAGTLLRTATSVDRETRTVDFVFAVPNPERKLRAAMFAQVSLATDRVRDTMLIPDEAVQTVRGRAVVFVESQRGQYHLVPVRLGRKVGESHEVLDGLGIGTRVVTTGSFVLKSEVLRAEFAGEQD